MAALNLKSKEEISVKMNENLDDVISEKVKIASAKQELRLEKILTFKFQEMIENKMADVEIKTERKLLSKYEKDIKNLEGKLRKQIKSTEDFQRYSVTKQDFLKLEQDFKNLKVNVNKDLQKQSEDLKKELKESSKNFIERVIEVKCEDIEIKAFNNLEVKFQKYSEQIKNYLSDDLELKLKKNLENERTILMNEMKSEMNVKGDEIKLIAIQEFDEELTKRLQNETSNCERKFNEKCELENLKLEHILKKQISSHVHGDIHELSKRLDVLSPRALNFIWEIEDFKDQLSNNDLRIESEVFYLDQIRCKAQFIFVWTGPLGTTMVTNRVIAFHVKYMDRPSDKTFPLNGHHRITFILHDQVDNKSHNDFIRILEPTFGDWTTGTLSPYFWVTKDYLSFLHSRWLKNGKIQVKVKVEPLNQVIALEPRHYGHIIWKIDHFGDVCECHQDGRQHSWSDTFYSSEKGYRMNVFLFVDDKVDFTLHFLKGPWDKDLPEKFQHITTVTLISQKDPSELKDKTFSKESDSTNQDEILEFTKADLEKYVENDSLIICFKVEAL